MRGNGRRIKWRVKGSLNGPTVDHTKDSIRMIRRMATESSSGPMEGSTLVSGRMESNTGKGSTLEAINKREKAPGRRAAGLTGSTETTKHPMRTERRKWLKQRRERNKLDEFSILLIC